MTGNLIINADPTANLGAATKSYVYDQVSGLVSVAFNGPVDSNVSNSFNFNVSGSKTIIFGLYLESHVPTTLSNNGTILDSLDDGTRYITLYSNTNYATVIYSKTYDNKFASSSIFESNNFIFGSAGSTFNNTFKI